MKVHSWFGLLAGVAFGFAQALEPCTEADISSDYTACDSNRVHTAYYYYNKACDRENGVSLPQTIEDFPCDVVCEEGEYLPFASSECAACNPGQYSPGNGVDYSDWENGMPPEMSTICQSRNDGPCGAWELDELYISSGNNTDLNLVSSYLYLYGTFLQPTGNSISFTYRVDAESRFDGLIFYIDNSVRMPKTSTEYRWKTVTFDLTPGFHSFKWEYFKDSSFSNGEDRAYIRSIVLKGTTYHADKCSDCPAGTSGTAVGNMEICIPCPFNQHQPEEGQTSCIPCEAGKIAYSGAVDCTELPPCTEEDIITTLGPCVNGMQSVTNSWATFNNTLLCNPALPESVTLPVVSDEVCRCQPGYYLNGSECVPCGDGEAYDGGKCHPCNPGFAAIPAVVYDEFSTLPPGFTSWCDGGCYTSGWIPAGGKLYGGFGYVNAMESFLRVDVTFDRPGTVSFDYDINCDSTTDCYLQFLITDNDEYSFNIKDSWNHYDTYTVPRILPPGTYSLTWKFHMQVTEPRRAPVYIGKFRFLGATVDGTNKPGADECTACDPGFGSEEGSSECEICPPGTYSIGGAPCTPVDPGHFTDTPGSMRQIPCGNGTTSNEYGTDCISDCTFKVEDENGVLFDYDLNNLYNPDRMYFAASDKNNYKYWVQMCNRESNNGTCYRRDGSQIESFACQFVPDFNFAVDAGRVIGFSPRAENKTMGLTVTFTNGDFCNNSKKYRQTTIDMKCDVSASIGSPRQIEGNEVEVKTCEYHLEWYSLYACPKCRQEDFEAVRGECVNNKRVISYVRKRSCWGEKLADEYVPCKNCPEENGKACSAHGQCDTETGRCSCEHNWSGKSCQSCNVGYYGANCLNECPGKVNGSAGCNSHGTCNYGLDGDGTCTCSTGFTGEDCSECAEGFEGDNCTAIPVSLTKVIPVWAIILIIGAIIGLVVAIAFVWRGKRKAEYKYTSLLSRQPMGMEPLQDEE